MPSTKQPRDYYSILRIDSDASVDEIRRAYRARARKFHPDMGGSPDDMKLLNEAYKVLTDPKARKAYDRELVARLAARSAPVPSPARSDSAGPPASTHPREIRWLIIRAVFSIIMGLGCFAESGQETLVGHPTYAWLVLGYSLWLLLLGCAMLYTAHRVNQMPADAGPAAKERIRVYNFVFLISIFLLVMLLTVLSLLLRP